MAKQWCRRSTAKQQCRCSCQVISLTLEGGLARNSQRIQWGYKHTHRLHGNDSRAIFHVRALNAHSNLNLHVACGKMQAIGHTVIWLVMSTFQTSGQRGYSDVTRLFLSCEGSGTPDYFSIVISPHPLGTLSSATPSHIQFLSTNTLSSRSLLTVQAKIFFIGEAWIMGMTMLYSYYWQVHYMD